jgi:hypothetical protein
VAKINPNASELIDEYIESFPEDKRIIMSKIREIIHNAAPDIVEDWKWGPNFNKNGMVCGFAAFKNHIHLSFFRGDLLKDKHKILSYGATNMHNRGVKFFDITEVNKKILTDYIKEAVKNNSSGIKPMKKSIELPDELRNYLSKNKILDRYLQSSYTIQKEVVEWIYGAKKPETKQRRLSLLKERLPIKK